VIKAVGALGKTADENWRGYEFGLSDKNPTATLNIYGKRGDFNSLLSLTNEGASIYSVDTRGAPRNTVQLFTLDTIWEEVTHNVPSPRVFLKMDTQGHDLAVALGAVNHLDIYSWYSWHSNRPVIELYDGMISMGDALKGFHQLGYAPAGFFAVSRPPPYPIAPEFDVLLTRFPVYRPRVD
jgi:hypothetical protein